MKKGFILLVMVLLATSFVVAKESVLIDFSLLVADTDVAAETSDNQGDKDKPIPQNRRTIMDFSQVAGTSFAKEDNTMKTSLAIENWDVVLNSSARTVASQAVSMTKQVTVSKSSKVSEYADKPVLGVRILFPAGSYNANAIIKPPFEIPAFEKLLDDNDAPREPTDDERKNDIDSRFQEGYGVIKNVGTIKSVQLSALGRKFPHSVYVILLNEKQEEKALYMGTLDFDGWQNLIWNNPQYISEVRNREIRIYPMYPQSMPFYKFAGLKIVRDAAHVGGDFVGYFKDIKVIYDTAVLSGESEVDDEKEWKIIQDREVVRQKTEVKRFGNTQVLRYLEGKKRATQPDFVSDPNKDNERVNPDKTNQADTTQDAGAAQ